MGIKKKDIFKAVSVGVDIGKLFVPGAAGQMLDVVSKSINDKKDPVNEAGLRAVAEHEEQQDKAILALHERVRKLEGR